MKALILAGGFGKRLWPLTLDKAKPLLPIAGKPVISHIVDKIPLNVPIIVSTNAAFADDFLRWRQSHPDRDITIYVEPAQSEGTKKGALAAVALTIQEFSIDEDLLMIGGDNFFTFQIAEFLSKVSDAPALVAHDIGDIEAAKKYGVVVADGTRVIGFQEKPEQPRSTLVGACFYFFPKNRLPLVLEAANDMPDRLGGVFERFLERGVETHVHSFPGYWNDIGSFDAYLDAHVQSGADLNIPHAITNEALQNVFEGVNHVDPSCLIKQSKIRNSIVLPGADIEDCTIDSCIIDRGAKLRGQKIKHKIIRPD
jgi:glucose-1-phosphate thymidylyltransferase